MRRIVIVVGVFLLVMGLLAAGAWQLLHSEAGNRWLVERAVEASGGALRVDELEGSLGETLVADAVTWNQDGVRVEARDLRVQGETSLWPPRVTLSRLSSSALTITIDDSVPASEEPVDWAETLEGLALPIPVVVDRWDLGPVDLVEGTAPPRRLLDSAGGSLRWDDTLTLPSLAWDAPDVAGQGAVALALVPPFDHAVELDARVPALARAPAVHLSLEGSAGETRLAVVAEGADRVVLEGTVLRPLDDAEVRLEATTESFDIAPGISLAPLTLRLDGPVVAPAIEADGVLLAEGAAPTPWSLSGRVEDSSLRVDSLGFEAGERRFDATGTVSMRPGSLHVDPLSLVSEDSLASLQGKLHYDLETEQVEADLAWSGLSWPLEGGEDAWRSPEGRLLADGTTSAWTGTADLVFLAPGIPEPGRLDIEAAGNLDGSRFEVTGQGALVQALEGRGSVVWSDAPRFAWQGSLRGLDLAPVIREWPSAIDARLRYSWDESGQEIQLDELGGTLRGAPLAGEGSIRGAGGRWVFEGVQLGMGTATLSANGAWPRDRVDLAFSVPPGSAAARWLRLDGAGSATVDLSADPPVLQARMSGNAIRFGDLGLGEWSLRGNSSAEGLAWFVTLPANGDLETALAAGTLRTTARGLEAALEVSQGEQGLALAIESDAIDWEELRQLLGDGEFDRISMTGRLVDAGVSQAGQPLLTLSAPASFRYAASEFSLSEACWRLVDGGGGCLEGGFDVNGTLSLEGTLESVPLGLLASRLGIAVVPDQEVSGGLSLRRAPGELPSGVLTLDLTEGSLRDVENPDQVLDTGAARLDVVLEAGQLRTGVFDLPLPGVGSIEASLQASDVRLDGTGKLQGRGRLQLTDLAPLEVLVPDLQRISGEMTLEVDLTGTLGEPFVDGLVRLVDVSFAVPFLGLTVTDLNGEGYARGQGEAALQADFRIGEGTGRLLGDVDLTPGQGFPFIFRIEGENLRLVETPDIELDANPAFDLSWADGAWTVDGSLEVPRLRLTPRSTLVGQVSESDDVIIVAGEAPQTTPSAISGDNRFFGQLRLLLGEDVTLETDEAEARVGGELALSWSGPPEPTAEGTLTVDGEVEIFGPVLRVSDGNLRFPGVPVSNPALDLRAERDVFGNTQIRAAGVAIGGTARRPTIEAYTRP